MNLKKQKKLTGRITPPVGDWGDRYGEVGELTSNEGESGLFTPSPEGIGSCSLDVGD